jgi:hypothetical protein
MTTPSTISKRRTNLILIVLFMTLLWLPTLDSVFHFDWTAPRNENRAMADFPKRPAGWHGLQGYIAGLEAYFNDHFGCRKFLVRLSNKLKKALKETTVLNVLVGKDGWLFITDGDMIDHYSGRLLFTEAQLHNWQVLLEKRQKWLAQRGIAYVFVVAPDKHTIYPEELPDWVSKAGSQTKLDQFYSYMREHSTVPVLDLRGVVRSAKHAAPTYFKTDTHWNHYGGFIGYQSLIRTIAGQLPAMNLEPMPLSAFTPTNELQPGGDLAGILGLNLFESNAWYLIPKPGLRQFNRKLSFQYVPDPIVIDNPQAIGRALFFRDSFATSWRPFLGYNFSHVVMVWNDELDATRIEREKPDIVVSEMVERFFNINDPKELMKREALN